MIHFNNRPESNPKLMFTFILAFLMTCGIIQANGAEVEAPTLIEYLLSLEESSGITVVSASRQVEPLKETPVPVTVITREMIGRSGVRNLKEALIVFVPGMTFVQDHNDINVAERGVYGSVQQKILILLDGHRLNNRSQSLADPDFGISLEKIKQIEVLRGPASALYGNVALTGVINLVTEVDEEVNGAFVTGGLGNNGQQKLSFLYGKTFDTDNKLMIWATHYQAEGEVVDIPLAEDYSKIPKGGTAILDGIRDQPSYDIGVNYRFGKFTLFGSSRYSKYLEPFSGGRVTGEVYNYDDYPTLNGRGPGQVSTFNHLGLNYSHIFSDHLSLDLRGYYDQSTIDAYLVIDPSVKEFGAPGWSDRDVGVLAQLKRTHHIGHLGEGNIIVGAQLDWMEVYESQFPHGVNGQWTDFVGTEEELLPQGNEGVYSLFVQLKHRLNENLILNLGSRYDYKDRHEYQAVQNLALRTAAIYLPNDTFSAKVSYAQSFVDAPYWYRYNTLPSTEGDKGLQPELLNSFQVTPTVSLIGGRIKNTFNFYYNALDNFIWRNNNATGDDPPYQGTGVLKSWGLENELSFLQDAYMVRTNLTYQNAIEAENYQITDKRIDNIPTWTGNLIIDFNPFYSIGRDIWFNLTARYIGEQSSPITSCFPQSGDFCLDNDTPNNILIDYRDPTHEVEAALLFNAGVSLQRLPVPWLSLDVRVYNLLNTEHEQGGTVRHPYPQPGRWFFVQLTYKMN